MYVMDKSMRSVFCNTRLYMPVFFTQKNGTIGIPLPQATNAGVSCLHCASSDAPIENGTTMHLCLNVRISIGSLLVDH
jgi:hypothetical protein